MGTVRGLSAVERERIEEGFRIPVDSSQPREPWIVSLDRESLLPTDAELRQIASYRKFAVVDLYPEAYGRKILTMRLPKESGHNTIVFRKGSPRLMPETTDWFWRRVTWENPEAFAPNIADNYHGLSLVEVMDKEEELRREEWNRWKKSHPSVFPSA